MPVGGVGFGNKSRVVVSVVVKIFPLIASHMFMILAVDCICSYHGPQLGPINVGMWNLLISIFVEIMFYECFFKRKRGLYQ